MKKIDVGDVIKGITIFSVILLISFIVIVALLDPLIQDVYTKGYNRGKNESCNFLTDLLRTNAYEPTGHINFSSTLNFSMNLT